MRLLRLLIEKLRQWFLTKLLKGLKQPWSYELFHAINEKLPLPAIEAVVLRRNKESGEVEVLLTCRPPDDPDWPRQRHVPGTVLRDDDLDSRNSWFAVAFDRIQSGELKMKLGFVGHCGVVFWRHKRGSSVSIVLLCIPTQSTPPVGDFFPVNNLPINLLEGQEVVIKPAVDLFEKKFSLSD